MKNFYDVLTHKSWGILTLGFVPMYLAIFQPSWKDTGYYLLAEFLSFQVIALIDKRLFLKIFPSSRPYFLSSAIEAKTTLSLSERHALLDSLLRFPLIRAAYCSIITYIKVIPSVIIVTYVWKHPGTSNLTQALMFYLVETVTIVYFFVVLYLECHAFVSDRLAEVHGRNDWSESFRNLPAFRRTSNFLFVERLGIGSIWVLTLSLQATILLLREFRTPMTNTLAIVAAGFGGLILMSRIWFLSRMYFVGGLETIFTRLEVFDPKQIRLHLALHSTPLLARFEHIFNSLMDRLTDYDRELAHWTLVNAEENRQLVLGETASIVVHDLGNPMHTVQFCVDQIKEDPQAVFKENYVDQLFSSTKRACELVESLRAYLRNPSSNISMSRIGEVFVHINRVLKIAYGSKGLDKVSVTLDDQIKGFEIAISPSDLGHVFYNLLSNSVQNLLENKINDPKIQIGQIQRDGRWVTLAVEDNGTGLSPDEFERLTSFASIITTGSTTVRHGLGMRLVRRLIERYGGSLVVEPSTEGASGTRFLMKLPLTSQTAAVAYSHSMVAGGFEETS